jgi:HAD superfamily hydrolase (TIGR01549 family)
MTQSGLAAILFDLGDVIMREETEEKIDGVTQRADLVPGMADLLRQLRRQGQRLGLVADTRVGTYRNVLRQHDLHDLFDTFAISDLLGCVKPDRRMFAHALDALGIPPPDWPRVVMVGNNLARDIRGANALGLISVWLAWNERYPTVAADPSEQPRYQVGTPSELAALLAALDRDERPAAFAYPRPFPWAMVARDANHGGAGSDNDG